MKRVWALGLVLCLCLGLLPVLPARAAGSCTLCILEVQTQGFGGEGEEDQDFVIVANVGSGKVTSSGIQLRYFNAQGVQANSLGIGTFEPGQTKVYASKSLASLNSSLTGTFDFGIYSGGGSLQIARGSGATATVYDRVGWGQSAVYEGFPAQSSMGGTLARKEANGMVQDTDNNSVDFDLVTSTCVAVEIREVQPFVADQDGQAVDAWIELFGVAGSSGDCLLTTKAGDRYILPMADLPAAGKTAVVNQGVDAMGQVAPLHLGEGSGQVWIAGQSVYAAADGTPLVLPHTTVAYTNMVNGQSWALVGQVWRRTFQPTLGAENVYLAQVAQPDDPLACSSVRVSEVLPNPKGEDTDKEWVELVNESAVPVSLANCQLLIGGEDYRFLSDDVLGPHEWRAMTELYDAEDNVKSWTLRNGGTVLIAVQRVRASGLSETVQAFEYADAPEGSSWARFATGWRWVAWPTPGLDNTTPPPTSSGTDPTEFPEVSDPGSSTPSAVTITELLPNPASPATDGEDEFVELFNSGEKAIDLTGCQLQTGNNFSYSYTITNQTVAPHSYLVVTSGNSSISLANSGGRARLVSPEGEVVSETTSYVDAPEGNAWALLDGAWQWTATPTPGAANKLQAPVLTGLSKAKTTPAKKATSAVKSAAKTTTPKAPKSNNAAAARPGGQDDEAVAVASVHPMVLAVVGGLAVLYAAYEYRQDIANKLYQLRRNRAHRRNNRKAAEGRGAD